LKVKGIFPWNHVYRIGAGERSHMEIGEFAENVLLCQLLLSHGDADESRNQQQREGGSCREPQTNRRAPLLRRDALANALTKLGTRTVAFSC
jgi:hypothetical protein